MNFLPQAACQGFPLPSSISHTRGHLGGPLAGPLAPAFALSCPLLRHKLQLSISCDRSHICSQALRHSAGHGSMWGQHVRDLSEVGKCCVCSGWQSDPWSPQATSPKAWYYSGYMKRLAERKTLWQGLFREVLHQHPSQSREG